ncbi:hypothetical protein EPUS_00658 [Endocarpon pusillum Z07020]|uniref:Mitochondrial outer membrane transport complex Sam37/metaxin N-terminal domain-containing protein n=1 Tax=Endocarpon pusillum (strain Z07020 / HMAS-L-300199) TaxID=1263415 RepID=U1HRD6_ENDPU|nr:uncharacterized protein EPUS_00658 [Endocarpon pusillum Z07020]ERF71669.1 hypothetical protein EPUS_00658 [Endocarpon pusillum Z07020]
MVLELHVWGPAFGLPSIDAQCLATVAYLKQCLPPSDWRLIPCSDPSVVPTSGLPVLKVDSTWVHGFGGIVNFLREHSLGKCDLDQDLNAQQRADTIAFFSFLESRGQPLLDLSLYVSSENYTEWTRPALAQILPWPKQWILPHRLRDAAKVRSEHLGLSSLDIEAASTEDGDTGARGAGNIPKNLVAKPKQTVASMLGKIGQQNQFRLDAVTSDFFEPLSDLVNKSGGQSWVFGTGQASSLDCLLLGYMALMNPPLIPPRRWLQDALVSRYPVLLEWTTNFRQECFGGPVSASDVFSSPTSEMRTSHPCLPWHSPTSVSIQNIGSTFLTASLDSLPIVSRYSSGRIRRTSPQSTKVDGTKTTMVHVSPYPLFGGLGVVGSALGAYMAYYMYRGSSKSRSRAQYGTGVAKRNMTSQRDFGEAGRMLGLI